MKQHNGLLFLESTEGVGTAVTIVLPLYEEPEEAKPTETSQVILKEQDQIPEDVDIVIPDGTENTEFLLEKEEK